MVHYYMYKKTNKIKKHRQIDKHFIIKLADYGLFEQANLI